jgi:hypothetical protein
VNTQSTHLEEIEGQTGSINGLINGSKVPAWQNDAITMVTSRGVIKAQPSALSSDSSGFGSSFSMT